MFDMTCLRDKHIYPCPQIIKQLKTGTSFCQDINLSIHVGSYLPNKSSPTNFNALRTCYISVRNIYERFCNLAHMGLSQSHAPLTEIWLSPHRARFMLVLFLFCCLTFWTSTFGIQTTNFFLMVVRRTSE